MLPNGSIVAERHNPAVPNAVLRQIWEWKLQGATPEDVIDRLRSRTVPPGYVPHAWSPGKDFDIEVGSSVFLMHGSNLPTLLAVPVQLAPIVMFTSGTC